MIFSPRSSCSQVSIFRARATRLDNVNYWAYQIELGAAVLASYDECYRATHSGLFGEAVQLGSVASYVPAINPDWKDAYKETFTFGLAKFGALKGAQKISILARLGHATETVLEKTLPPVLALATAYDLSLAGVCGVKARLDHFSFGF